MSPPTSCIVSVSMQPISLVTGFNWKSEEVLPTNWKIDVSVNITSCSLKVIIPVISAPIDKEPAPEAAVKSESV